VGSVAICAAQAPEQKRSPRAGFFGFERDVRVGAYGVFRRVHELVALHTWKLACDFVAHLFRGDTVWVSVAKVY